MSIVARLIGSKSQETSKPNRQAVEPDSLADGAIDTLSNIFQTMASESFQLDTDPADDDFPDLCREFSSHVSNGTAIPSKAIEACDSGTRRWNRVRQFYAERRKAENSFVTERLQDYRGVVSDLVNGLKSVSDRNDSTESSVLKNLNKIESAVSTEIMSDIRGALSSAIHEVGETFAEQKRQYEEQLLELNERMLTLRQDLVAARKEMTKDALTGAYNRRAFDASILQTLNTRFILNQPATLVLVDLDCFKSVNDTYGHASGDEVLRSVGDCLTRAFIRRGDFVSRYGGDEFAVILNDTSAANSEKLVARFLKYVNELAIHSDSGTIAVSCSVGFTDILSTDSAKTVIERADGALYKAKRAGKNRYEIAVEGNDSALPDARTQPVANSSL